MFQNHGCGSVTLCLYSTWQLLKNYVFRMNIL